MMYVNLKEVRHMKTEMFENAFHLYTLENAAGTRLAVTDAGAAVVSLIYRGTDVVLGWGDGKKYAENPGCFGATVGRCANRIAFGSFSLNGTEYALARNDGPNNLHSGPDGWHCRRWETVETGEDYVTFYLDSPDGDQGFPGRVRIWVMYTLTPSDSVHILYKAVSDEDTILNVTNHTYFNLNGHDSGSAEGHTLRLYADAYTPSGPGLIPTGEIADVTGTPFDFRTEHAIGHDIECGHPQLVNAKGYDHNFCLSGAGLRPAALLRGEKTGITLEVSTDRPGVQLYTGNFLSGEEGKNGAHYPRRGGVCLETQCWPDAIHNDGFPSPVLPAGEEFRSETVWKLEKTGSPCP